MNEGVNIKDLEERLTTEFETGFKKINKEFTELFGLMFDGGDACLVLTKNKKPFVSWQVEAEIEGSEMFKLYQAGRQEDVEKNLIWELLHAYPYTPKKALKQRMKLLENMAENAKRDDIKTFLEWVISRFGVTFQAE